MIDTEKLSSLTHSLKQIDKSIEMLENLNSQHFKDGHVLEITVKSSLYGTIDVEKINTYKSAKKYITPMLETYQARKQEKSDEITNLISGGSNG